MLILDHLARFDSSRANENQRHAIEHAEGPLLIIAGPGSGKSFTLVERVVHLIQEQNLGAESLLVVTFTEKAAAELKTRISNRLTEIGIRLNVNEMYLGTFHSVCLRLLEEYREHTRLKRSFTLMDQFDQQYFLYQNLSTFDEIPDSSFVLGPAGSSAWAKSERLLKWVNTVSEEALEPSSLLQASDTTIRALGACTLRYHELLAAHNALDFSTIQYEAYKLLTEHPEVLSVLQSKLHYLMVDEYQDTNAIQEKLLMLLAGEKGNLCVVGDDDQGLYRFRGATIRNILEFPANFPGRCEQERLTVNYRSHPDIIHFYNSWMREQDWTANGITFRYAKEIQPRDGEFPPIPGAVKVTAPSSQWHDEVLSFLQGLQRQGNLEDWNQVAFLFRSVRNPGVQQLARHLEDHGIPVYAPRSNQFFEREEIRLIIGALIFLFPQFSEVRSWSANAHLDIWDYYDHDCFAAFAQELRKPENADLLKWARSAAKQHYTLSKNMDYGFTGLFYQLLRFPLFSRYLNEDLLKGGMQETRSMRNLGLFSQLLNKFEYLHNITVIHKDYLGKDLRTLFNRFIAYLKQGGISEHEDDTEYAPSGCVSFLTIHQSKGLEFPVVVVGSLDTSPRKQYGALDTAIEPYLSRPPFEPLPLTKYFDFRRLYYTAFSRAQNLLVLACPEVNTGRRSPSKYFKDFVDSLPSWRDPRVNLRQLELERIKEVTLKREYSFTGHLALYETCAEQYRFFKELGFTPVRTSPMLFGTLVHQTIEDIHKAVLKKELERLNEEQIEAWFDLNYAHLTQKERVYLTSLVKGMALEHVLRYYRHHQGDWGHLREAEVDVSLIKDDYILTGKVDLIQGQGGTVEIVDFKTEKKPEINSPEGQRRLGRYRRQLEVYAHIVEERTGVEVGRTHLYYTGVDDGNPYISFSKDRKSLEGTMAEFDSVVRRIERNDFAVSERPTRICEDCDMRYYCDAKDWVLKGEI